MSPVREQILRLGIFRREILPFPLPGGGGQGEGKRDEEIPICPGIWY